MALAGKQLRQGDGFVGAVDPPAAELRFEGVRRLMRRAQVGVNKDHRMGQHHMAAARRQRPPVLGGTDNLTRRLSLPAGEIITAIAKGTAHRPGVAGNAEAREGALQHSAQRVIDGFGGFAERLLHRPGEAEVDNPRPLGHQTAPERRSHTGQPRAAKCALTAGRSAN